MSLRGLLPAEVSDFGGPWLRLEPTDVPPNQALLSLNSEYNPGSVSTRTGFTPLWNLNEAITAAFNWVKNNDAVSAAGNYYAYFSATSSKVRILTGLFSFTQFPIDLFTQAGAAGASFASNGTRMAVATFAADGTGAGQCRIVGIYGSAINTDKAFLGAMSAVPTLSETGTGVVTQGTHRVGYILQTRNGFVGPISPTTLASSTITASGGKQIGVSITATWPTEASLVFLVMSPVTNLSRYFIVPGIELSVPAGFSFTINTAIDISDDDLIATGTEVTDHLNLFTQDAGGNGPFNPFQVIEYKDRLVYLTVIDGISQAYISDPGNPQSITADQHVMFLPGERQITGGFVQGDSLFLYGPHWTYFTRDNGDVPATWTAPTLVDGAIGSPSIRGVTVNPSMGFAWVAHESGLYLFSGGYFSSRPISYYVDPDWKRINWGAAQTIQVADNKDKQQVVVLVPLDGATSPTHMMMFDYSNGTTPEAVKYSLWNLSNMPNIGSAIVGQNDTKKRLELWISNAAAGEPMRQMNTADDVSPYNDNAAAINWQYETALLPGTNNAMGQVWANQAVQIRAKGSGTLSATTYGLDRTKTAPWTSITLAAGREYTKRLYLPSEGASHRFSTNAANQYCILSALRHFYSQWVSFRK